MSGPGILVKVYKLVFYHRPNLGVLNACLNEGIFPWHLKVPSLVLISKMKGDPELRLHDDHIISREKKQKRLFAEAIFAGLTPISETVRFQNKKIHGGYCYADPGCA